MFIGHYTAFCRDIKSNKWQEFDDERVRTISEEKVVDNHSLKAHENIFDRLVHVKMPTYSFIEERRTQIVKP